MILNPAVDRSFFHLMTRNGFFLHWLFTFMVSSLQDGVCGFCGTGLRCKSLEWNDPSAPLRLALNPKNRTFHPVQLPNLG